MEQNALTFYADTAQESAWLWGGLLCAITAAAALYGMSHQKKTGRRGTEQSLARMLLFFLVLMGAGAALFSGLAIGRLHAVVVGQNGIEYGKLNIPWREVRQVYVADTQQKNALNQTAGQSKVLVVERSVGTGLLLFEGNYPVLDILRAIRQWTDAKED
ncbi:MAG: hypothetical protein RL181_1914 [Bacteroidota bacterium]|jgi:hypothetical protein